MRKRKTGRKFHRETSQRQALLISLARALVQKGKIFTSEAKAKELAPLMEQLLSGAEQGGLESRRKLTRYFENKLARKVQEELVPRYQERRGGCTRIIKIGPRKSDASRRAMIELI